MHRFSFSLSHFLFLFFAFCCLASCRCEIAWQAQASGTDLRLQDVYFLNQNKGFALGGKRYEQSCLLRTEDGGSTWQKVADSLTGKILFKMGFADENHGFIAGLDGKILETIDGGNSWTQHQQNYWLPMTGLAVYNDTFAITCGGQGYSFGHLSCYRGNAWEQREDTLNFEARDVQILDENTALICGYGAIIRSTDAGRTWAFTNAKNDFFSALHFPSHKIGYAVGRAGSILKSVDGGQSWKTLRNGNSVLMPRHYFNDVLFINEEIGYLVGDKGLVWKTTDGGKNWKAFEKYGKEHLYGIFLQAEGNGFVVGDKGLILRLEE